MKPLNEKGDKSECGCYRAISPVCVGSKLFSIPILFRLGEFVRTVLREEYVWFYEKKRVGLGRVEDTSTKFSLFD